jgi:hypothetical protein
VIDSAAIYRDGEKVAMYEASMSGDMQTPMKVIKGEFKELNSGLKMEGEWEQEVAEKILLFFGWHPDRKVQLRKVEDGYTWTFEWKNGKKTPDSFSVWNKDCAAGFKRGIEILGNMKMLKDIRAF